MTVEWIHSAQAVERQLRNRQAVPSVALSQRSPQAKHGSLRTRRMMTMSEPGAVELQNDMVHCKHFPDDVCENCYQKARAHDAEDARLRADLKRTKQELAIREGGVRLGREIEQRLRAALRECREALGLVEMSPCGTVTPEAQDAVNAAKSQADAVLGDAR